MGCSWRRRVAPPQSTVRLNQEDGTAGVRPTKDSRIAAATYGVFACAQVTPVKATVTVETEEEVVPAVGETLGVSEDEYVKKGEGLALADGEPLADNDVEAETLGDTLPVALRVGVGLGDTLVEGGETLADAVGEALLLSLSEALLLSLSDGGGDAEGVREAVALPLTLGLREKEKEFEEEPCKRRPAAVRRRSSLCPLHLATASASAAASAPESRRIKSPALPRAGQLAAAWRPSRKAAHVASAASAAAAATRSKRARSDEAAAASRVAAMTRCNAARMAAGSSGALTTSNSARPASGA